MPGTVILLHPSAVPTLASLTCSLCSIHTPFYLLLLSTWLLLLSASSVITRTWGVLHGPMLCTEVFHEHSSVLFLSSSQKLPGAQFLHPFVQSPIPLFSSSSLCSVPPSLCSGPPSLYLPYSAEPSLLRAWLPASELLSHCLPSPTGVSCLTLVHLLRTLKPGSSPDLQLCLLCHILRGQK